MTVYRHFAGKDELVTATLERWSEEWLGWLQDESGPGDDAGSRLEGLWDALEKWFANEGFRGPTSTTWPPSSAPSPATAQRTIAAHRAALRGLLREIAAQAGATSPRRRPPAPS